MSQESQFEYNLNFLSSFRIVLLAAVSAVITSYISYCILWLFLWDTVHEKGGVTISSDNLFCNTLMFLGLADDYSAAEILVQPIMFLVGLFCTFQLFYLFSRFITKSRVTALFDSSLLLFITMLQTVVLHLFFFRIWNISELLLMTFRIPMGTIRYWDFWMERGLKEGWYVYYPHIIGVLTCLYFILLFYPYKPSSFPGSKKYFVALFFTVALIYCVLGFFFVLNLSDLFEHRNA